MNLTHLSILRFIHTSPQPPLSKMIYEYLVQTKQPLKKASVWVILNTLEKQGWIVRHIDLTHRYPPQKTIELTKDGHELVNAFEREEIPCIKTEIKNVNPSALSDEKELNLPSPENTLHTILQDWRKKIGFEDHIGQDQLNTLAKKILDWYISN